MYPYSEADYAELNRIGFDGKSPIVNESKECSRSTAY